MQLDVTNIQLRPEEINDVFENGELKLLWDKLEMMPWYQRKVEEITMMYGNTISTFCYISDLDQFAYELEECILDTKYHIRKKILEKDIIEYDNEKEEDFFQQIRPQIESIISDKRFIMKCLDWWKEYLIAYVKMKCEEIDIRS